MAMWRASSPRDAILSAAIKKATTGFAIARTDSGEILAEFGKDQVVEASRITDTAKVQLAIDVTVGDEADQNEYNRSGTVNGVEVDANDAPSEVRSGEVKVDL